MRNNLLAFLAEIRRESRTKIPPTITPSPSAYVNTRPVTTEKTSAFIASGVLSEEGPGSRTVLFYRNFSASRNNTNGQSVKRCYFSGQSRRPCGLTINSPGDCVAIGCCWDSSLIQTVQCFQPTSERGLSQHLRPTNESRPVSRDELLSPISETGEILVFQCGSALSARLHNYQCNKFLRVTISYGHCQKNYGR